MKQNAPTPPMSAPGALARRFWRNGVGVKMPRRRSSGLPGGVSPVGPCPDVLTTNVHTSERNLLIGSAFRNFNGDIREQNIFSVDSVSLNVSYAREMSRACTTSTSIPPATPRVHPVKEVPASQPSRPRTLMPYSPGTRPLALAFGCCSDAVWMTFRG